MSKRIALVGGGTGGHVTPIVALTRYIRSERDDVEFLWIGESDSMESKFALEENIAFEPIASYRIPSMWSFHLFPAALFRLVRGIIEARSILKRFNPSVLFSKWWPGAISVVLAAKSLHIPIYIHDSDIIPGVSNRMTARFADFIFLGRDEAKSYFPNKPTETVGQLLDPSLAHPVETPDMIHFESGDKTRVFVFCGSQWSRTIYTSLIEQLPNLQDFEFIIALGTKNEEFEKDFARFENVRALPWIDKRNVAFLYREADIVLVRWGITVLAEASAFGAKIIAIPLPIAAFDHQRANVRAYEAHWLIKGLEESELSQLSDILKTFAGRRIYTEPQYDVLEWVKRIAEIIS